MKLALLIITLVLLGLILLVLLTWEQCEPREGMSSFYLDPSTGQRMPVTVCKETL